LIGRRLPDAVLEAGLASSQVWFSSRRPLAGHQSVLLDMSQPEAFHPEQRFEAVIICAPIWLVSEALLNRLFRLGMKRLVVFSSTSRLTKSESEEPAEREIVQKLQEGETVTTSFCHHLGISFTILRPTLIFDEGQDANVSRIAQTISNLGFFPVCGKASGLRQPVHARDLARAAVQALSSSDASNKSFNLSGADDLTYRVMVERIFLSLGRKPVIISLPESMWRMMFTILHWMRPKNALKQNIHMVLRMNQNLWFDHSAATRAFGYAPAPFKPDFSKSESRKPVFRKP